MATKLLTEIIKELAQTNEQAARSALLLEFAEALEEAITAYNTQVGLLRSLLNDREQADQAFQDRVTNKLHTLSNHLMGLELKIDDLALLLTSNANDQH
jgi:hypothetical protein